MSTSYSKNIYLSNLFVCYTLNSIALLSSCLRIKTGLFFSLTFCCTIIPISGIIITVLWKIFKKSGENKNKLRTTYLKNHENFENSKSRVQFYWFFYKKNSVYKQVKIIYLLVKKQKNTKKKFVLHSNAKRNQPDRCRIYDMQKCVVSTV